MCTSEYQHVFFSIPACITQYTHNLCNIPHCPLVALLKAAFICAKIVEFPSTQTLKEQLETKYGCGFQLESTSRVPQGSGSPYESGFSCAMSKFMFVLGVCWCAGLGTSSVLGGAIMAALWRASGWEHSRDSLIHAVSSCSPPSAEAWSSRVV